MIDEELYQRAQDELDSDERRPELWARARALADNDEDEARFLYTNLRVEEILKERDQRARKKATPPPEPTPEPEDAPESPSAENVLEELSLEPVEFSEPTESTSGKVHPHVTSADSPADAPEPSIEHGAQDVLSDEQSLVDFPPLNPTDSKADVAQALGEQDLAPAKPGGSVHGYDYLDDSVAKSDLLSADDFDDIIADRTAVGSVNPFPEAAAPDSLDSGAASVASAELSDAAIDPATTEPDAVNPPTRETQPLREELDLAPEYQTARDAERLPNVVKTFDDGPISLVSDAAGRRWALFRRGNDVTTVRGERHNWRAMLLTLPWLLRHKLFGTAAVYCATWLILVGGLLVTALAWIDAGDAAGISLKLLTAGFGVLCVLALFWLPLTRATGWLFDRLQRNDYELIAKVRASNRKRAVLALDSYLKENSAAN